MATKKDLSTSKVTTTKETLIPSNNKRLNDVALLITGNKPNEQNYLQWFHAIMMFICSRGKYDYFTDAVHRPTKEDPKFK